MKKTKYTLFCTKSPSVTLNDTSYISTASLVPLLKVLKKIASVTLLYMYQERNKLHLIWFDDIELNGATIEKMKHFRFLGVHIDDIYALGRKRLKALVFCIGLKIIWNMILDTLMTLYDSFIYPYIIYFIEVWGFTTEGNPVSLLKLQKVYSVLSNL